MSNKLKEVKYRVFDHKGTFQQTYSGKLDGAFSWARDCARRTAGYIVEHRIKENDETSDEIVLDFRDKK